LLHSYLPKRFFQSCSKKQLDFGGKNVNNSGAFGKKWCKVEEALSGFYGQYQTTMDDKGRFALPAKLRSVLGADRKPILKGDLIITGGMEGCLSLYPQGEWADIQNRLSSLNFTKRDFRYFGRRFYSSAAVVTPDRNGRILIPAHLVKEASLTKELQVIGVNRWIEIWDPVRYQYYLERYAGSYEEVAERLFSGNGREEE